MNFHEQDPLDEINRGNSPRRIGDVFAMIRDRYGLDNKSMAETMMVSRNTIGAIINGKATPQTGTLQKLCSLVSMMSEGRDYLDFDALQAIMRLESGEDLAILDEFFRDWYFRWYAVLPRDQQAEVRYIMDSIRRYTDSTMKRA